MGYSKIIMDNHKKSILKSIPLNSIYFSSLLTRKLNISGIVFKLRAVLGARPLILVGGGIDRGVAVVSAG